MMRIFNYFIPAMTTVLLMASCVRDPLIDGNQTRIPLNISGSINQRHTKVNADGFIDADAVGLFAVNYTDNNATPGTLAISGNQADNVKYVFSGSSHKWIPAKSVYYKDDHTNVDIYLYYPYQSSINSIAENTFEVKKDQSTAATANTLSGYEESDFLWGKGANVAPSENSVAINLSHKMSAVQVTLEDNGGFSDGEFESLDKSVILMNTTRKAAVDLTTGVPTPIGGAQADGIVMCPQSDGSFRAVVIPQTVDAQTRLFSITVGGVSYGFKVDDATEYKSGKQMNITIKVAKKTPSGEYDLTLGATQITDWTEDLNTHGGTARQYYVVNVETPGALKTIIEAAGKNPAKIRNLKVTGRITTSDFYYMRDKMTILEAVNLKEVKVVNATIDGNDSHLEDDIIPYNAFNNKKTLLFCCFPDNLTQIGSSSFSDTHLSGHLTIPDNVTIIGRDAFYNTHITSVTFSSQLKRINYRAFSQCRNLTGPLNFPPTLEYLEEQVFSDCKLSGTLRLPDNLKVIGRYCFNRAGSFSGGLKIPDKIKSIGDYTFSGCGFKGSLDLNNVTSLGACAFDQCQFSGELVINEDVIDIPSGCFRGNKFTKVHFPSSLRTIQTYAFEHNQALLSELEIPEGVITIEKSAFAGCRNILKLILPSTLQVIQQDVFSDCFYISSIVCSAIEPPTLQSGVFDGVAKDNFTVEVPAASVTRYKTESGWSDFKRISAHYDFSISRDRMRVLNAGAERTFILRAPEGMDWSVTEKPDWVTVSPSSGTGKTDVTITVSEMQRTDETFQVNEGSFNSPSYKNYKGRADKIEFTLSSKEYSCSMDVEQYDCDYADGDVRTLHTATKGPGIDIVFIGDGYDARDIVKGTFFTNAEDGYTHFFNVEPYKTYKEYFNVKEVVSLSNESGIMTVNTIVDSKFGSIISPGSVIPTNVESCFSWARKANPSLDLTKSLTIMLMNVPAYEGLAVLYGDGSALACCPVSTEAYPYDFRGIIQHEAGGHGFGKLGDEYIYHNFFIRYCSCTCCDHPDSDGPTSTFGVFKSHGWYKNLSTTSDNKQVPWSHLIYREGYSDVVDMYEGGYMHSRGMYRSESTSCMNNNIPYYSAISRQSIVERIMYCAGESFDINDFYEKDSFAVGPQTKAPFIDVTFGVDPLWNLGNEHGSVYYMGEHPDYSKIK